VNDARKLSLLPKQSFNSSKTVFKVLLKSSLNVILGPFGPVRQRKAKEMGDRREERVERGRKGMGRGESKGEGWNEKRLLSPNKRAVRLSSRLLPRQLFLLFFFRELLKDLVWSRINAPGTSLRMKSCLGVSWPLRERDPLP